MTDAKAEGLTLARSDNATGFKYVMPNIRGVRPFKLHPDYAKLREGETSFATAAEAALALARLLGPDGSAEMAKPSPHATPEDVEEAGGEAATANGGAFNGLFGGFVCDHCLGKPDGCGKLLRSAYWAMVQGRECRGGTREADGHVWDPDGWYPTGDRGCDGRLYTGGVWTCLFKHPNGQRCSAQVPGFGTGSLFGVSIAGHDPEDPERFRPAAQPKAKVLAHEASHEMPLTKEEAQEACFSGTWWEGNRKRVYELEKADNETGFAGVYALAATSSGGYANKKRFICHEATGAFFTPEEAALERAKSIAKKQKT